TAVFKTTGTAASTHKVKDIHAFHMAVAGNVLYLSAQDATHGAELWRTNGTPAGTRLVKDINHGAGNSLPANMTGLGPKLIFTADDGKHGLEVWRSDGTATGTILLKDVNPHQA